MASRIRLPGRIGLAMLSCLTFLPLAGCTHVRFGDHASFDSWYAGRDDAFRIDQIGFEGLDGSFTGYVLNDIVIRTPVYVLYEAVYVVMIPIALPYYGVKSITGSSQDTPEPEAPPEEPEADNDAEPTGEVEEPPPAEAEDKEGSEG